MTEPNRQLQREKILYRYHNALLRGDFATVEAILRQAEGDPVLEQMVLTLNAALQQEEDRQAAALPHPAPAPSANGRSVASTVPTRIQKGEPMMVQTAHFRFVPASLPHVSRRWGYSITLAAAVAVVILLAGLLALQDGSGPHLTAGGGSASAAGAALPQATVTPSATALATNAPATAALTPTPTPVFMPSGTPLPVTVLPPEEFVVTATVAPFLLPDIALTAYPMLLTAFTAPNVVPTLTLDETIQGALPEDAVLAYRYTADQDGPVIVTAASPDFVPRLLLCTLDDAEPGIWRSEAGSLMPSISLDLNANDRVLIFVFSADSAQTGEFLLNLRSGE